MQGRVNMSNTARDLECVSAILIMARSPPAG
jgi:hypothetical protein